MALQQVEMCANCRRKIGKLEISYIFNENIVCEACNAILSKPEPIGASRSWGRELGKAMLHPLRSWDEVGLGWRIAAGLGAAVGGRVGLTMIQQLGNVGFAKPIMELLGGAIGGGLAWLGSGIALAAGKMRQRN